MSQVLKIRVSPLTVGMKKPFHLKGLEPTGT